MLETLRTLFQTIPPILRSLAVISIAIIILASFLSFGHLQNFVDDRIRDTTIDSYKERQILQTEALSQHIGSDFTIVTATLKSMANSAPIQNSEPGFGNSQTIIQSLFDDIDHIVYAVSLIDSDGVIQYHTPREDGRSFVGTDVSSRDYVRATLESREAFLSEGFEGMDGQYSIVITNPIIDLETGEYRGLLAASVKTPEFFERYSAAQSLSPERLMVIDKKGTLLFAANEDQLVGANFLAEQVQDTPSSGSQEANILAENALQGATFSMTFTTAELEERFVSTHPITVNGDPQYFVIVSTPTAAVHGQVDEILSDRRVATFVLLAAIVGAVAIIVLLLSKSNAILDKVVSRRTRDLESANKELVEKNEQLQKHDMMQREFINVAAHELRTPIQPIIGVADILQSQFDNNETNRTSEQTIKVSKSEIAMIMRNAERLEKLSSDLLMATKIETVGIALNIEKIDLSKLVAEAVEDAERQVGMAGSNTQIIYRPKGPVFIDADRQKLLEVVSNLLGNATKFAKGGTINVLVETSQDQNNKFVTVKIQDDGPGIHSEIMPRLFTKFASRSEGVEGTGLGLYIAKNIVDAHGGVIWGENNKEGRGATFAFRLPAGKEIQTNRAATSLK